MITKISYEKGAKPNKHTLKPNEFEYNAVDNQLYTIDKFGALKTITGTKVISDTINLLSTDIASIGGNISSIHSDITAIESDITAIESDINKLQVRTIFYQYDSATRSFGKSWGTGKTWSAFTKTAGNDVLLSWRCPFRNDSESWGGGYIDIQVSCNGGAYASIGNSGYDGGVMILRGRGIGSMSGTILLNLNSVRNATKIQLRFRHHSYDGTVTINGSHNIGTGSMGAFWSNITMQEVAR